MKYVTGWIVLCFGLLLSASVRASDTPYRLVPALDAPVMSVSAVVWGVPSLFPGSFIAADGCSCRIGDLNRLDRPFAGTYSAGFSVAGELVIAGVYASTLLLDLLDVVEAEESFSSFLVDLAGDL